MCVDMTYCVHEYTHVCVCVCILAFREIRHMVVQWNLSKMTDHELGKHLSKTASLPDPKEH